MKRYILIIIGALFFSIYVQGEVLVSADDAQNTAMEYYKNVCKDIQGVYKVGKPEKCSLLGKADMWLVPVNDSWILVSSDKRTEAVLARFMHSEKPDLKSFPPAAQYLISCYEHDIAYVRDTCKDCPIRASWQKQPQKLPTQTSPSRTLPSYVAPLLGDIAWAQYGNESWPFDCDKVYNRSCPVITTDQSYLCGHAVAGCVAVAVGQIMRYWKWPYMANVPTTVGGSNKEMHFFEFEHMPSWLSNSSSVTESIVLSNFLRDCGYDMGMNYGESSFTTDAAAVNTFIHFGYDSNSIHNQKKWYTSGWTEILHSNIADGKPVYYTGRTAAIGGEGHTFILDGYDVSGLYHVNLGWGIYYNDYYYIDTITAGGSSFSHWQSAIWGIQPDSANFCPSTIVTMPITTPYWGIARAGSVTLDGVVINSNTECRVYSSSEVRLTVGTEIHNGSKVHIAIKDIPCSSTQNSASLIQRYDHSDIIDNNLEIMERKGDFSIFPNPTKDVLYIQTDMDLKSIRLYNLDGCCLINGKQKELHISHLPVGIYMLQAETTDGQIKKAKVLHYL